MKRFQGLLALAAVVFGLVTIFAGGRVLLGGDPGYVVFRPLLVYNTVMGFAYVAAGVFAWRNLRQGKHAAAVIFSLNIVVLGGVAYLQSADGPVAVESVLAMALRTVVWFALLVGLTWLDRIRVASVGPDA